LINWFKRLCLPDDWQRLNLQTIRNRLLLVPAQLLRPQGRPILSLPSSYPYSKAFIQIFKNIKKLTDEKYHYKSNPSFTYKVTQDSG
jgi:hypothetical protein